MLWSIWAQYTRLGIVHPSPAFHSCESHSSANIGQSTLRVNVIRVISIVEYHHNRSSQINLIYKKIPSYCFALCTSDFVWHKTKLDLIGMRDDVSSGGQGVGLQCPRGSRSRPTGSHKVRGKANRVLEQYSVWAEFAKEIYRNWYSFIIQVEKRKEMKVVFQITKILVEEQ